MIKTTLFLFLLYSFVSLNSQNVSNPSEPRDTLTSKLTHQYIQEISVQAPIKILSPKQWPGGYSGISNAQLQLGNAHNLQEQLNKLPGVVMQQGTMSTNRITIRGIGSRTPYQTNRIKAYWGQMPLTDGDGATALEDIGLNDIGSMELLKGPASSLYGAGLGGVILMHPFSQDGLKRKTSIKSEIGSFGTHSHHAQLNLKNTNSGNISLVGGAINTDGYRQNSTYRRYNATLKGQQVLGAHYLNFLYNFLHLKGEIPSSLDSLDFKRNPKKAASSWNNIGGYEENSRHMLSLGLVSPIKSNWVNAFTVFAKTSTLDELRPFNRLNENRYSYGLRNKLTFTAAQFKAEVGTEIMIDNNNISLLGVKQDNLGQKLNDTEHRRQTYNIFALLEYQPVSKLVLQAAFNYNQTGYRTHDKDAGDDKTEYSYNPVLSPRLGFNYQLSPQTYVFGSMGHGFSAPSVEEAQMPDGSFNKNIKPEEGMSYEVGARYSHPNARVYADVTLYLMRMENLLVTERDAIDQFYGKNAGKTKHQGLEGLLGWDMIKETPTKDLNVTLSYFTSQNKFDTFVDDGIDYKNKHLPGIPRSNTSVQITGHFKPFRFNVNHSYTGSQYLNDSNTKQYTAYHKTNAKASYYFTIHKINATVYLGADNIFDNRYASMVVVNAKGFGNTLPRYYYPGLPFNVFGGLELRF